MLVKEQDGKINFIDENDCFVGFDFTQQCCESFDHFVTLGVMPYCRGEEFLPDFDFDGYKFDTSFDPVETQEGDENYYCCHYVTFKMVNVSGDIAYLHLYNMHAGFYFHGWKTSWGCKGYV